MTDTASRFEIDNLEQYDRFVVSESIEISYVLRTLLQSGTLVSVDIDPEGDSYITTLLALDEHRGQIVFDSDKSELVNHRLPLAHRVIMTGFFKQVKTQFVLKNITELRFDGKRAFASEMPEFILRLQRREYFRQMPLLVKPLYCAIRLPAKDNFPAQTVNISVSDLSRGGMALSLEHDDPLVDYFQSEDVFKNCQLRLDETLVELTIRIRNIFKYQSSKGAEYIRMGCEYVDIGEAKLATIQRYVLQLERERKARVAGY